MRTAAAVATSICMCCFRRRQAAANIVAALLTCLPLPDCRAAAAPVLLPACL